MQSDDRECYGLLAEFDRSEWLLTAAHEMRKAGYRYLDAFSPFPIEGLSEAIGFSHDRVPLFTLLGGIAGGVIGYVMQWYSNVIDYPINVGGRPLHSWPAFVIITFELTVLGAALSTVFGMLFLNRLPELYHPLFTRENFSGASKNRFFLCVLSADPLFDRKQTFELLQSLRATMVSEVAHDL